MMRLRTLICLLPTALLVGCNVTEAPLETNRSASGPEAGSALSPGGLEVNDGTLAWSRVAVAAPGNGEDLPGITGKFLVPGEDVQIDSSNNIRVKISVSSGTTGNDLGLEGPTTLDQLYLILAEADDDSDEGGQTAEIFEDGLRWPLCPDSETENGGCTFREYEGWISGVRVPNLEALGSLPFLEADDEAAGPDTLYLGAEVGEQFLILDERPFDYNPTHIELGRVAGDANNESLDIDWIAPSVSDTGSLEYVVRSFSVDDFIDGNNLLTLGGSGNEELLESELESGFVGFLDGLFQRQERIPDKQLTYRDERSEGVSRLYQVVGVNGHGIVAESEYVMTPPYLKTTKLSKWREPVEPESSNYWGGYYLQYFGEDTCRIEWDGMDEENPEPSCLDGFFYDWYGLFDQIGDDFYPPGDDLAGMKTGVIFPCLIWGNQGTYSSSQDGESVEPISRSVDIVLTDRYGGVRRQELDQTCPPVFSEMPD